MEENVVQINDGITNVDGSGKNFMYVEKIMSGMHYGSFTKYL